MANELTTKQQKVLDAVREFQAQNGFPPTVRELAEMFGQSSTAGIHKIYPVLKIIFLQYLCEFVSNSL